MSSGSEVINTSNDLSAQRIMVKTTIKVRPLLVLHLCVIVYFLGHPVVIFVYVCVTCPKIVSPQGTILSQQGVIFGVPISNVSALSIKRRLIKYTKLFPNDFVYSLSVDRLSSVKCQVRIVPNGVKTERLNHIF